MTIKKLAVLGSVLAGAAFLQNKTRRDRLMRSATDLISNARDRLSRTAENLSDKTEDLGSSFGESGTSGYGQERATTPSYSESTSPGRNGIY